MADPTSVDIAVRDSDLNPTSIEAQRAHLMARHLAKKRDLDDMMQQMMDQGCQGISDTDLIAELDKQMTEYQAKRSSEKEGTEKREHWIEGYTGGIFDMDPEDIVYLVIHPRTVFDLKILFDLTPFPTTHGPPLPFLNSLMDNLVEGKLSADEIECFVKCFIALADLGPKCQKVQSDNIAKIEAGHHNRSMVFSRRHIMLGNRWFGVNLRALLRLNEAIKEEKEYMKKQVDEHMMLHYMMAGEMTDEIRRLAQQDYLADRLLAVELGEDDEALKDHVQAHEQREKAIKARWREQAALQQGEEE